MEETRSPASRAERHEMLMLRSQAERLCAGCPFAAQCLSDAVTKFDVVGYVAGTTRKERHDLRLRLGISVASEDLDAYAGVNSGRQYDGAEILRLRAANPNQPLSMIAQRLGCSVSTVKRHLRRIEDGNFVPKKPKPIPSPEIILATLNAMKGSVTQRAA
ncbi:WhiB family transcriptional regulator [Tessaracoccus sp. OH4464_COT-324]|uniref:WhiB family transcriptional regulator n=1 Tax=Tessaracoccus sp. OH4464_COT-324 TaxID=2491059 RepID=UPI00131A0B92|nr:WhiB family transcriptional regulator [Tessaracoccus sp. OH4464_COT-324]